MAQTHGGRMKPSALAHIVAVLLPLTGCSAEVPHENPGDSMRLPSPHEMPSPCEDGRGTDRSRAMLTAMGFWTSTGDMAGTRQLFPLTLLGSGKALASGGLGLGAGDPTAEL